VSGLSGWPAFRGVSMEVWSQWKPGLLSVFLTGLPGMVSTIYPGGVGRGGLPCRALGGVNFFFIWRPCDSCAWRRAMLQHYL
jgi:hypothetical protein